MDASGSYCSLLSSYKCVSSSMYFSCKLSISSFVGFSVFVTSMGLPTKNKRQIKNRIAKQRFTQWNTILEFNLMETGNHATCLLPRQGTSMNKFGLFCWKYQKFRKSRLTDNINRLSVWQHAKCILEDSSAIKQDGCKSYPALNLELNVSQSGPYWVTDLIE